MIRHIQLLFVLLFAALVLSGCNKKVSVVLDDIESYIQTRPDSALAVIRSIDTTSLTTRRARAQYSLLHAMALDKNWIDTTDINVVMPAVKYYDRHKSSIRRAKSWYYLGRIQQNDGDISESAVSFKMIINSGRQRYLPLFSHKRESLASVRSRLPLATCVCGARPETGGFLVYLPLNKDCLLWTWLFY